MGHSRARLGGSRSRRWFAAGVAVFAASMLAVSSPASAAVVGGGDGGGGSDPCAGLSGTLTLSSPTITLGQSILATWSTQHPSGCGGTTSELTGPGAPGTVVGLGGSQIVVPPAVGISTYSVTAFYPAGHVVVASASVTVQPSPSSIIGPANMCVDVSGANSANGTAVQLWTCNGGVAQQWTPQADGTIHALGKCLDVRGGSTTRGTRVQLWDCNGGSAQTWVRNNLALINPASGLCLDDTGANTAAGTPLQIWDCTGLWPQQWTLPAGSNMPIPGGNGDGTLQSQDSGANGLDILCRQSRDSLVLSGDQILGSAHTDCEAPVSEMQILVELFVNGIPVGDFGHDQDFGTLGVAATARATCIAGYWLVYAQTLVIAPPGYTPAEDIIYPGPSSLVPQWVSVGDCLHDVLINMSDGAARDKIAQVGGRVGTVTHQTSSAPIDSVISESVEADGVTVDIVESNGNTTVPSVLGMEEADAITAIQGAGLVVGTDTHTDDCRSPGDVEIQNPTGLVRAVRGQSVNITVSTCTGGIPK